MQYIVEGSLNATHIKTSLYLTLCICLFFTLHANDVLIVLIGRWFGGFDSMEHTLLTKGLIQKEAAANPT